MENEYLTRQYREEYDHQKKLDKIREKGEQMMQQYKEPDMYQEAPERIKLKETMKNEIKDK